MLVWTSSNAKAAFQWPVFDGGGGGGEGDACNRTSSVPRVNFPDTFVKDFRI